MKVWIAIASMNDREFSKINLQEKI
jgi:hypothetical protein